MNGPSGSNAGLPATGGDPGDIQGGTAGAPPAGNNDALVPPGLHLGLPPGPPGGPPSNNGQTSDSAQQQARIAHLEAQLAAANGAAASGFNPDPGLWGGGGFGSAAGFGSGGMYGDLPFSTTAPPLAAHFARVAQKKQQQQQQQQQQQLQAASLGGGGPSFYAAMAAAASRGLGGLGAGAGALAFGAPTLPQLGGGASSAAAATVAAMGGGGPDFGGLTGFGGSGAMAALISQHRLLAAAGIATGGQGGATGLPPNLAKRGGKAAAASQLALLQQLQLFQQWQQGQRMRATRSRGTVIPCARSWHAHEG